MHIRLAQPLYVKNFTTIDGRGADVHVAGGAGIVGNMMPAVARGGGGGKDQWHWHSVGDAFENGAWATGVRPNYNRHQAFPAASAGDVGALTCSATVAC
uniref:Uncharacterized protein n=1 Tax=Oryza barthii TaxID=65489 RepID=A0A0D3GYG8_9ORYZ